MTSRLVVGLAVVAVLGASCGRTATQSSPSVIARSGATSDGKVAPGGKRTLRFSQTGWRTDFSKTTIDIGEIESGGPPKDGIAAIDRPKTQPVAAASAWLPDRAPVISVAIGRASRAYPLEILIWHEIVNDTLGGRPIVVTFCPLCNTALVFDRTIDSVVHDFGTTGNLRYSDLVMYDRQTETWWQQAVGQGIVGELAGRQLAFLPSQIVSFADFGVAHPDGDVLTRDTGYDRPYGENPYVGYDATGDRPFLYDGVIDGRLAPKERVVTVDHGGKAVAFPYSELAKVGVASATVGGEPVVVFWTPSAASPLDTKEILGRDIGATGVFSPVAAGGRLEFARDGPTGSPIRDRRTGSTWSITGLATAGPLAGLQLVPILHGDHFWFAWAAFEPATTIWTAR